MKHAVVDERVLVVYKLLLQRVLLFLLGVDKLAQCLSFDLQELLMNFARVDLLNRKFIATVIPHDLLLSLFASLLELQQERPSPFQLLSQIAKICNLLQLEQDFITLIGPLLHSLP